MIEDYSTLEARIRFIEERNKRVESEKAWEISLFRKSAIAGLTYIIAVLVLYSINGENPFLSALIPTIGYLLSVQSLPFIKNKWIKRQGE